MSKAAFKRAVGRLLKQGKDTDRQRGGKDFCGKQEQIDLLWVGLRGER